MDNDQIHELVGDLVRAIRAIASGGGNGPDGLEAVAMALAGDDFVRRRTSVAQSIDHLADAVGELAEAIRETRE